MDIDNTCFNFGGGEVCLLVSDNARKTIWWFMTGKNL